MEPIDPPMVLERNGAPKVAQPEEGGHGEAEVFDPAGHRPTGKGLLGVGVAFVALLALLVVAGVIPRQRHEATLQEDEKRALTDLPTVRVAKANRVAPPGTLTLPGSVQPLQETSIYARANGYVRKWYVDIGAPVKRGQVLVELDVPDVDEQLREAQAAATQAQAGIAQANTQLKLARTTIHRYRSLGPSGVATQQEIDQYQAAADAQESNVAAAQAAYGSAQANVHRYQDLKSFATVVAPFDGVVTARSAEIGQLVVSGTGLGPPLFKVADISTVRIFVNVPQLYSADMVVGMGAPTTIRETPGKIYPGKLTRTSNELDLTTRSLLAEVDIPNPDRTLLPGMYAQVSFDVKHHEQPVVVPATSVLFDAQGTRAAAIHDGVVHWTKVDIASDLGDRLAIASGIADGDLVALNPSDHLIEGMKVTTQEMNQDGTPKTAPAGKAP